MGVVNIVIGRVEDIRGGVGPLNAIDRITSETFNTTTTSADSTVAAPGAIGDIDMKNLVARVVATDEPMYILPGTAGATTATTEDVYCPTGGEVFIKLKPGQIVAVRDSA
jgi:hypothetical protein